MPHIHTKPGQHDHTVSIYILRTDLDEPKILLHVHKKFKKWMQFGGHIELNEDPWSALTHELREESGYDLSQLQILQPAERIKSLSVNHLHPVPAAYNTHEVIPGHLHTDISWIFTTTQEPRHQVGADESSQIKLFSQSELRRLDTYEYLKIIAKFAFEVALPNWETIDTAKFNK